MGFNGAPQPPPSSTASPLHLSYGPNTALSTLTVYVSVAFHASMAVSEIVSRSRECAGSADSGSCAAYVPPKSPKPPSTSDVTHCVTSAPCQPSVPPSVKSVVSNGVNSNGQAPGAHCACPPPGRTAHARASASTAAMDMGRCARAVQARPLAVPRRMC